MATKRPVTNLSEHKAATERALRERLLKAHEEGQAKDDGRRYSVSDLREAQRERL